MWIMIIRLEYVTLKRRGGSFIDLRGTFIVYACSFKNNKGRGGICHIPLTTFDFPGNSREFTERLFELIKPYIMCRYGSILLYTHHMVYLVRYM